ncbi:MAG: synthase subunit epsilon [Candidatus Saccharibacteria bacterium]|nr:synthase subunit epsilon [Candidatus Saccharibacteria bacterium]
MRFELLTLTGSKFEGEADEVQLTTTNGQMGILPHHEPFVGQVVAGPVTVKTGKGEPEVFATYGGLLEITPDYVRLMADEADTRANWWLLRLKRRWLTPRRCATRLRTRPSWRRHSRWLTEPLYGWAWRRCGGRAGATVRKARKRTNFTMASG